MQKSKLWWSLGLVLVVGAVGCAKQAKQDEPVSALVDSTPLVQQDVKSSGIRDSDSNNASGLNTIHFPYNSSAVEKSEKNMLKQNLKILRDNKGLQIQIEGHCDQRGGIQYNLGLGEKRAKAVKKFLTANGVAGSRISVISLGKEKPIDNGQNEQAYAKNRRANFVIKE